MPLPGNEMRWPRGRAGDTVAVLFAPDLVGPAAQIVEQLHADAAVQQVSEFRIELPYEFNRDDYEQILHDVVHAVAPELGWKPGGGNGQVQSESG